MQAGEAPAPCPLPHSQEIGFGSTVAVVGVSVFRFSGISFMPWKLAQAVRGSGEGAWMVAGGVAVSSP